MDHYEIQARSMDWVYVLNRLIAQHSLGGRGCEVVIFPDRAEYRIPKALIPAAALAKAIGTTEEKLGKVDKIELHPIKKLDKWEQPTVPYYGEA